MKLSFKEYITSKYKMTEQDFETNLEFITNYMLYNGYHLDDCFKEVYNPNNVCLICTMQNHINDYNSYCMSKGTLQIEDGMTFEETLDRSDDAEFLERYEANMNRMLGKLGGIQGIDYLG